MSVDADIQFEAMSGCDLSAGNRARAGVLASKTRLKKPTIISSQLCWPQITVLVGWGFSGLSAELSKWAVHSILAPFGRLRGVSRLYQSCQRQLYLGTLSSVSVRPSG